MAKHKVGTIFPVEQLSSTHYRCEVRVTDGSLMDTRFYGEGSTANQAESQAVSSASAAIGTGLVDYQHAPVPDEQCLRCGELLAEGKAIFSLRQLLPSAMWEGKQKAPELRECLKCPSCGYSETKPPKS